MLLKIKADLVMEKETSSKQKIQIKYLIKENESLKEKDNKKKSLLTDQTAAILDRLTPGPLETIEKQCDTKDEFIEGNSSLEESATVVIKPVRERDYEPGKPWIGEISKVTTSFVFIKWLKGTYSSVWIEPVEFKNCKPDKVQKKLVAGTVEFNRSMPLSNELVKKIKRVYNDSS